MPTSRRVTSPPSSSMATRTSSRSARSCAVSAASCSGEEMLRPNRPTEARPSPRPAQQPVGGGGAGEAGLEDRQRVPGQGVGFAGECRHRGGYPFTAPVRPLTALRWRKTKRMRIGIAKSEEAAMVAPQSSPKALRKLDSHSGSVWDSASVEDQHQRELVPGGDEAEQRGRHQSGREQRQDHPAEGLDAGAAVDHGRLLQLLRDGGPPRSVRMVRVGSSSCRRASAGPGCSASTRPGRSCTSR
ncbi:hypothetical protein SGLAM104S_08422 [Streptomyces glaucescens]